MTQNLKLALWAVTLGLLALAPSSCSDESTAAAARSGQQDPDPGKGLVGSQSCKKCHDNFHALWSTSHHGLAMQPFTAEFAAAELTPTTEDVMVGEQRFSYVANEQGGNIIVREGDSEQVLTIEQALGGKNVYYLLTPVDRGRLQVLPIAYDVNLKEWYDTTGSMVRQQRTDIEDDEPLHWTDPLLTFNTSCYRCHVSQLQTNYDLENDSYATTWAEPGINCETCHGPCGPHVERCLTAGEGNVPDDLAVLRYSDLTIPQRNANCGSCHTKGMAISRDFVPGDILFNHFDIATFEDHDFYPDGRDLGENYTTASWLQSECSKDGQFDCIHCHTSSGRYRFANPEVANQACMPCHEERVANAAEHHRHPEGGPGSFCRDCHMPMTTFARMRRSDHSMRPPSPAATQEFGSPNACNLCHTDEGEDAAWAEQIVAEWHPDGAWRDAHHRHGKLVADARAGRWGRLTEMLAVIADEDRNVVLAASLIRLLIHCPDARKVPAFVKALSDPSPLVRAAAATGLAWQPEEEAVNGLLRATGDSLRLVRVRAAEALAGLPREGLSALERSRLEKATDEYVQALQNRPDDWSSHQGLGNFHEFRAGAMRGDEARIETEKAIAEYELSARLRADVVTPLVNASRLYDALKRYDEAEAVLRRALAIDPENAAAHFNLGLLLSSRGNLEGGEQALRAALKTDPDMAPAAYNLGVLLFKGGDTEQGLEYGRRAVKAAPEETRYAYTLAFHLRESGNAAEAILVLEQAIARQPMTADPYLLLIGLYRARGDDAAAAQVTARGFANERLPQEQKARLQGRPRRR